MANAASERLRRKIYRTNNLEQERQRTREFHRERRASGKTKTYNESTIRHWLSSKIANVRKTAKKYGREVQVDADFLVVLWTKQNGLCALTGLEMTTKYHCPFGASLDRIDSNGGYTVENVQLVCKAINLAKNNLPDAEILKWIGALRTAH